MFKLESIFVCKQMNKFLFLFLFVFAVNLHCAAQQAKIDSIEKVLENEDLHDSLRVFSINGLAFNYRRTNPEKTFELAHQALQMAEKLGLEKEKGRSMRMLGAYHYKKSNYDSSIHYHEVSASIFRKIGNKREEAFSKGNLAICYDTRGEYEKSIPIYNEILVLFEQMKDTFAMENVYHNIGVAYERKGNPSLASEYFIKSLKFAELINDKEGMGYAYGSLANLYQDIDSTEKSFYYENKSLEVRKEIGDSLGVAMSESKLAGDYMRRGEPEKAVHLINSAVNALRKMGDEHQLIKSLENRARIFEELNRFVKAEADLREAFNLAVKNGEVDQSGKTGRKLAAFLIDRKKYDEAKQLLKNAIQISQSLNSPENLMRSYKEMALLDTLTGDFKAGFRNYLRYQLLKDSLDNNEYRKQVTQLEALYRAEKKEAENQKLIESHLRDEAELSTQRSEIFGLIAVAVFLLAIAAIYYLNHKKEKTARILLGEKNEEILQQKEEISTQAERVRQANEELSITSEALMTSHDELERKNADITASINYASRIQRAILPFAGRIQRVFPHYFILFRPRDIVSGDFYWFQEKDDKGFFVAADCTGHGVPGAFMSMIGSSLLDQIVLEKQILQPDQILQHLHEGVRAALQQDDTENPDGMDMSLVVREKGANTIQFAGAKNQGLLVRGESDFEVLQADRQAIGGGNRFKNVSFTKCEAEVNPGDMLYLFSDGYRDQFGGEKKKKMGRRKFYQMLMENSQLPLETQQTLLASFFDTWLKDGNEKQLDDVLVVGFRF